MLTRFIFQIRMPICRLTTKLKIPKKSQPLADLLALLLLTENRTLRSTNLKKNKKVKKTKVGLFFSLNAE